MEPKDLKNSDELRNTKNSDLENSEKNVVPAEDVQKEEQPLKNEKTETTSVKKEDTVETVETLAEPVVEETVEEKATEPEIETESKAVTEVEALEETAENSLVEETQEEALVEEVTEVLVEEVEEEESATEETEEVETTEEETTEPATPVKTEKVVAENKEKIDYTKYTQLELVNALREILESVGEDDIKEDVDAIRSIFYRNYKAEIDAQKKAFLEADGNIEEFVAEVDPYEQDIKELLKNYRQVRIEFNKKLDVEKEDNLKLKYQVIEDIKSLINTEESINKTFQEFRDLQRKWREIGLVPQAKMKNLWDTYHFHVENFYDYIKINKELRDLDLKKNLEAKIILCERAEELLVEPNIIRAFNTLQKYHEQWREIGPVPVEQKDDIWERFKAATAKINKKHQEYFESRKDDQKNNLDAKTALCEKVEEINEMEISTHKDWDDKSRELVELQKVWRTIGFAPRKDNNKIYDRFRNACDKFFDAKRDFYSKNKELQQNNLQLKIDLCIEAEALKDNTDWKKTTQDFINIQKKWKEIGPVPRKHSDVVWKRFRAACDFFFDKKSEHFSSIDSEQVENLRLKKELIAEVENFKASESTEENLRLLKSFQRRWTEIGHVPLKKKDEIQIKFREAVNKLYDDLNLDEEKRNLLRFRTKMTSYSESNRGQNKMRFERDKYMNKLKQLENDLVLLDNNIGFFAKSKNAESLIKDVKRKIENTKEKIEFLKEKIRVIDEVDTND